MSLRAGALTGLMNQPSAQVIDGSLKFDRTAFNYLDRTFSAGNRRTFTFSFWVKASDHSEGASIGTGGGNIFSAGTVGAGARTQLGFGGPTNGSNEDKFQVGFNASGSSWKSLTSDAFFRDFSSWQHVVCVVDVTQSTASDRVKFYSNGKQFTLSGTFPSDEDQPINSAVGHAIGRYNPESADYFNGLISNFYFLDGLALGPGYFGFTDPLTNTWRPRKFRAVGTTINDGTVWSSLASVSSGSFQGSYPATNAFNGTLTSSDRANGDTNGSSIDLDFSGKNIIVKNDIAIWSGKSSMRYSINGGEYISYSGVVEKWKLIPFSGRLTSLKIKHGSDSEQPGFSGLAVDGVTMLDSTTTNLDFGTNGFYLPMDGNSPIGQDRSGKGNNFQARNFGGSVALDNPQVSGAKPILNTTPGGTRASFGVFGSRENVGYAVTVYNPTGSQNRYYLDGVEAPTLTGLIRGATYTFDQSDSTNDTHPLVFGTTAEGNNFNVTAITGASAGTAGAATTITIPYDGPNTIYYHCSAHSGMGSNITGITTNEKLADQYASHCVLALPLVGGDDDVSASIACTSTTNSITNSGVDFVKSYSNFYNGSADYTGASTDVLNTASDNTKYQMGTGNFTVECWVYSTSTSGTQNIFQVFKSSGSKYYGVYYSSSSLRFQIAGTGGVEVNVGDIVMGTNKWTHVAMVRDGGTLRAFVDGVQVGSGSVSANINEDGYVAYVGRHQPSNNGFTGYMQEFRIYKGVAKYTSDFVVPSPSPNILPDTPSGVSGGSKLTKIIDGAVAFDGSSDSLKAPDSSDLAFGTGEFTVEMFFYANTVSGNDVLYDSRANTGSPTDGFSIVRNSDQLRTYTSGEYKITPSTFRVASHRWYHLAITRESTTQKMYINGELVGSATVSNDFSQEKATIGSDVNKGESWDGVISNVRLIKGSALYTKNFTPPSAPLTNVTDTKLLCCQSPTSADVAAVQPSVTSYFTGGTALTWASFPIGSKWTLTNGNKNATSSGGSGYTGADVFSVALAANTTYAWTLDITNGDSTGGWYFADVQSNTGTHADQKEGNSAGLRGGETGLSTWGDYATANSTSSAQNQISMNSDVSPNGTKSIDFVVYRPSSGQGKVWVKANTATTWIGGGNPSDTSSTATFEIPDATTYFGFIDYDSGDTTNCNMRGDGDITLPPLIAHGNAKATNFNPFNTDINTVRGQETGYATLNPLYPNPNGNSPTDGNLKQTTTSGNGQYNATMSIPQTGSWYWEVTKEGTDSTGIIGISTPELSLPSQNANNVGAFSWYIAGPRKQTKDVDLDYGNSVAQGDVVGVAYKSDIRELRFYLNGVDQGVAFNSTSIGVAEYFPAFSAGSSSNTFSFSVNFGQKPFKFPPPDGFQSLNDINVRPETVITRPDQYVGVTTYNGTGNPLVVTGLNMKPDLIWIKNKGASQKHTIVDSVRTTATGEYIASNSTQAEGTGVHISGIENGISIADPNASTIWYGQDGDAYVAWAWKAGGKHNTFNIDDIGYASASDVNMSVGSLNDISYNKTQTWSNNLTVNTGSVSNAAQAFNGNLTNGADSSASTGSNDRRMTATLGLTLNNETVEVYPNHTYSGYYATIDGVDQPIQYFTTPNGFKKMGPFTGTLTSVTVTNGTESSSRPAGIRGIRVGKALLVDNGVSTSNVPSIAPDGCSVGTKQGFSIIKYEGNGSSGATLPHGLTQAPDFAVVKNLDETESWGVYHSSEGGTRYAFLNSDNSFDSSSALWNDTDTTSLVLTLGDYNGTNKDNIDFIAYLWHNVPGLQKFGTYEGNNDADGPFVELGFNPAIIWTKGADSNSHGWEVHYNHGAKLRENPQSERLMLNEDASIASSNHVDFLSNGFKIRNTFSGMNNASETWIYCAWADVPSFNLHGGQSNAR